MVKKAQLLEDATDFTDRIKGKFIKKEMTSGQSSARPTNGKKRPFNIMEGSSQEKKPKVFVPNTPSKSNRKHYDKPGHTTDEFTHFCLGSVDTRSSQVDTRPSFQQINLHDWDIRSTLDQSRSCKPSFQEEGQGNQRESLERRLLCKAREQIELKRLRRRRISGISDAIKAEHRQLRRISIDFHQGS
ncbi:hypothetical protein Taro_023728 [Colocasia esculenta]|uniref:Uncharacterized protein n=1 Tax=Colocasia esculenta TaxID=4460 RepID=A0A843VCB6_COLES|nr:hypothetical protein [Colocasia esculenta]